MDFLNQINKSLTDAGSTVSKKAKDMADIMKLNDLIHVEEEDVRILYSEIGEKYFNAHREDNDAEFKEQVQLLKKDYNKIDGWQKEIDKIKGIFACKVCGGSIPFGSTFCANCGVRCIQEVTVPTKKCLQCGAAVTDDDIFCTECGAKQK